MPTSEATAKVRDLLSTKLGRAKAVPAMKNAMFKRVCYDIYYRYSAADGTLPFTPEELARLEAGGAGRVPYRVQKAEGDNKRMAPGKTIIQDILHLQFAALRRELDELEIPFLDFGNTVRQVRDLFPKFREVSVPGGRAVEFRERDWTADQGWASAYSSVPEDAPATTSTEAP